MGSGAGIGLRFRCRELVDEIVAIKKMAEGLLDSGTALACLKGDLERICRKSATSDRLLVLQPLHTKPTRNYEAGTRSGGTEVYALVTGKWQVRSVGGKRPKSQIAFTGKASALVELWPAECPWQSNPKKSNRLAMWRIELGAQDSPGCYFHFQVLGDRAENPFPKNLPIPRLPSPFVSPMAAVEFVLGELFQDRWSRKASLNGHHHKRWRAIQRSRWSSLMKWQAEAVQDGPSSPWMNLKAEKPPDDLFLAS